jgi:hypothetical protein
MSLRRFSLAIKPAGSSLPTLIRKPVLKRVRAVCNWVCDRAKVFCATSELTLVLIRVMRETSPFQKYQFKPTRSRKFEFVEVKLAFAPSFRITDDGRQGRWIVGGYCLCGLWRRTGGVSIHACATTQLPCTRAGRRAHRAAHGLHV